MKFRSAFAVLSMTVALAACGNLPFQQEDRADDTPAHSGPPGVSPLEQPIETGAEARAVSTAEASTMSTAMFRAAGSGWTATAANDTAVYERPGARSVGISVRRMTYASGVEFVGNMNGSVFALNIRAQECEAGGQKTPFTANLRVGSQRLTGCAAPTDTMPKAQTRASSAAPKPKAQPKPAAPAPAPTTAPTPAPETPATQAPATQAPATESPAAETPTTGTPAPSTPTTSTPQTPATDTPAASTPAPDSSATQTPAGGGTATTTPTPESPAAEPTSGVPAPALVLPEPPAPSE